MKSTILTKSAVALFALVFALSTSSPLQASKTARGTRPWQTSDLPLVFEANHGQASSDVRFLSRGQGFGIGITVRGVLLSFTDPPSVPTSETRETRRYVAARTLELGIVGGSEKSQDLIPEKPLATRVNYVRGASPSHWLLGLPTYARIRHPNVLPRVDLVVYGKRGHLEYDLEVHPGASPATVHLALRG
ncbi:MAG TPA: hypothetical protein VKA53_06970, partial [Thermoanaerobaculia bacterium]|nr:hypothetical protein [Thermoanaerobaculia bacterium]